MVERSSKRVRNGGMYFKGDAEKLTFIPSGCAVLDQVLGGGWPFGKVSNIVGDKSVGKTLLAIEATANFVHLHPKEKSEYAEGESAFDESYGRSLGMPIESINFVANREEPFDTVEDFYEDLAKRCKKLKRKAGLYILDSLDSLSDRAEMQRDIDEGTYGAGKAKQMSQTFRRLVREIGRAHLHLMIISQVRDAIGVTFGRKHSRTGGRALDFYASQVLYLAHIKTLTRTRKGVTRPIGVRIKAKCEKNKIASPMRECEIDILFGYGVDDITSNLRFLQSTGNLDMVGITAKGEKKLTREIRTIYGLDDKDFKQRRKEIDRAVRSAWAEIEERFLPVRKKYD